MIKSSKLYKKEYRKVKSVLTEELTLAIANEETELVFYPQNHTTITGSKTIKSFLEKFRKELWCSSQIEKVEIKRLDELYECKCHKTCLTIDAKFYSAQLTCGGKCERTFLDLNCRMFRIKKRCERMMIKRRYNVSDEALLLYIVFNEDYSSSLTKSSKKSQDFETSENNTP